MHQINLADNYDGAFMFDRIEKKYKDAGKEFIWQWFFFAKSMTYASTKGNQKIEGTEAIIGLNVYKYPENA